MLGLTGTTQLPLAAAAPSSGSTSASVASDALLRARCLASNGDAASAATRMTLQVTRRTPWGLFLAASSAGFLPDEPVLTLLYDPRWPTPTCLENANASKTGEAQSEAAVWYRAWSGRGLDLCLVGVRSGRVACGTLAATRRSHPGL